MIDLQNYIRRIADDIWHIFDETGRTEYTALDPYQLKIPSSEDAYSVIKELSCLNIIENPKYVTGYDYYSFTVNTDKLGEYKRTNRADCHN